MPDKNTRSPEHEKTKKILKIAGGIVLAAGIVFAVVGFIDIFSGFGSGNPPSLFWCLMVGFPAIAIGCSMLTMGFRREINTYVKNESVPVINEAAGELHPAIGDVISAAREAQNAEETAVCPACGERNEKGSKFCKGCGKPLRSVCPACGKDIPSDSAFCNHCGAKLR